MWANYEGTVSKYSAGEEEEEDENVRTRERENERT